MRQIYLCPLWLVLARSAAIVENPIDMPSTEWCLTHSGNWRRRSLPLSWRKRLVRHGGLVSIIAAMAQVTANRANIPADTYNTLSLNPVESISLRSPIAPKRITAIAPASASIIAAAILKFIGVLSWLNSSYAPSVSRFSITPCIMGASCPKCPFKIRSI